MATPNPRLQTDGPIEVIEARALFRTEAVRHRSFGSLARLADGRLLLAFRLGAGPGRHNDGAVMLTSSDDAGHTWIEPRPLFAYPGWDCLLLGGLAALVGDHVRLLFGRVKVDFALGGDEPLADWFMTASDTFDGGFTWTEPSPEIRLFPCWTELYGASNPHPLPDGRYLWAGIGTLERDRGWQAGVTFSDGQGHVFTPPVIVAAAPGEPDEGENREYGDADVVRLADGRFLMVIREFLTKESVFAHSADDGQTWTPIRPTGFKGANIKLHRLRSGSILCVYRDEDPTRRGVSCSVSDDGGDTWRFVGQLYIAEPDVEPQPGCACGYPDIVSLSDTELLCILHPYPDTAGHVDLHLLRLADRT